MSMRTEFRQYILQTLSSRKILKIQ